MTTTNARYVIHIYGNASTGYATDFQQLATIEECKAALHDFATALNAQNDEDLPAADAFVHSYDDCNKDECWSNTAMCRHFIFNTHKGVTEAPY